ncbi:MAG TPA: sulfite exporter TauE/SafE family protein, partial [Mobilitalea sp.]|nr:sulfite exporter TauE/SafE family protein [Mobilitalea sp.]
MSSKTVSKIIRIDGMTCVNCENKIERELSATEGIISAKVSYSTGKADVTFNPDIISLEKIEGIIERLDYHVFKENEIAVKSKEIKKKGNSRNNTSNLIGIVIIIFAAYLLISRLGFFNIFNAFPTAKANMGFGMLFLIGLLTSIHCVAMCGGICLSQCVPKDKEAGAAGKRFSSLRPSLLYNTGRVISYTIIGGIVGAIGSVISFSGAMRGIVQIVAGVFMIIMGLNMLNVLPWLRRFNPRMPKIFGKKIYALRESNSPFFIGLLNGLMPCGPLQAMQLYALSTGSMFAGAFSMFLFSVGTVPLMFVFGTISSLLSKKFTNKMMTVSAFLVIILGLFMFNNGTSLSGIAVPSIPIVKTSASTAVKTAAKSGGVAVIKDGVQTVTTTLSPNSYSPIVVQKGIPVKWTIQASSGSI